MNVSELGVSWLHLMEMASILKYIGMGNVENNFRKL